MQDVKVAKEVGVVDEEVRVATIMQVEVEEEVEEEGVPEDLVDVPTTVEEDVVVVQDVVQDELPTNHV